MANEKTNKVEAKVEAKTETKKVEAKVVVPKVMTIADAVRTLGVKGAKDRNTLAQNVVNFLKAKNVTINNKHKEISVDHVHSQIGAICRCIEKSVGPKIWKEYKTIETETEFKILPKN